MTLVGDMKDDAICAILYTEDKDIIELALKEYYFKIIRDEVAEHLIQDILIAIGRM